MSRSAPLTTGLFPTRRTRRPAAPPRRPRGCRALGGRTSTRGASWPRRRSGGREITREALERGLSLRVAPLGGGGVGVDQERPRAPRRAARRQALEHEMRRARELADVSGLVVAVLEQQRDASTSSPRSGDANVSVDVEESLRVAYRSSTIWKYGPRPWDGSARGDPHPPDTRPRELRAPADNLRRRSGRFRSRPSLGPSRRGSVPPGTGRSPPRNAGNTS